MSDLAQLRRWAEALIAQHLDPRFGRGSWTFGFDAAKRRAGLCDYAKRRITVSRYIAEKCTDSEAHQVLLHEVAHALAGPQAKHGANWVRIATALGYVGGRTHTLDISRERATWIGHCPAGHEHYRFKRPTVELSCTRCHRGFSRAHLVVWQHRTLPIVSPRVSD